MLRHKSCIPDQPVPIYLSTHISNSFLGRFTRKTTIGCRDPNQGVFLTSLNKLAILMQNHLIKSSRESPMLLPIHQDTRYVSRRINTCRENSLNIKFKVKHQPLFEKTYYSSPSFRIRLQLQEQFWGILTSQRFCPFRRYLWTQATHKDPAWISKFQMWLVTVDLFQSLILFNPKPPLDLGKQTCFQETLALWTAWSKPLHKYELKSFFNILNYLYREHKGTCPINLNPKQHRLNKLDSTYKIFYNLKMKKFLFSDYLNM